MHAIDDRDLLIYAIRCPEFDHTFSCAEHAHLVDMQLIPQLSWIKISWRIYSISITIQKCHLCSYKGGMELMKLQNFDHICNLKVDKFWQVLVDAVHLGEGISDLNILFEL